MRSEGLQYGQSVPGQEVYDELVDVLVAARHLFPKNSLDLVLLAAVGSPKKRNTEVNIKLHIYTNRLAITKFPRA